MCYMIGGKYSISAVYSMYKIEKAMFSGKCNDYVEFSGVIDEK